MEAEARGEPAGSEEMAEVRELARGLVGWELRNAVTSDRTDAELQSVLHADTELRICSDAIKSAKSWGDEAQAAVRSRDEQRKNVVQRGDALQQTLESIETQEVEHAHYTHQVRERLLVLRRWRRQLQFSGQVPSLYRIAGASQPDRRWRHGERGRHCKHVVNNVLMAVEQTEIVGRTVWSQGTEAQVVKPAYLRLNGDRLEWRISSKQKVEPGLW